MKVNSGRFEKGKNTGSNHQQWKGGRVYNTKGYVLIYKPDHPRTKSVYILEHILVIEKKIGRYLEKGEIVHHINGIRDDNKIENLIILKTNAEHRKLHKLKNWSRKRDFCVECGKNDSVHRGKGMCQKCYAKKQYRARTKWKYLVS